MSRGVGAGGLWRGKRAQDLAQPEVFDKDPALVWQFYQYRRNMVAQCKPNAGHTAIAAFQDACASAGKTTAVVTQNIDGMHQVG